MDIKIGCEICTLSPRLHITFGMTDRTLMVPKLCTSKVTCRSSTLAQYISGDIGRTRRSPLPPPPRDHQKAASDMRHKLRAWTGQPHHTYTHTHNSERLSPRSACNKCQCERARSGKTALSILLSVCSLIRECVCVCVCVYGVRAINPC